MTRIQQSVEIGVPVHVAYNQMTQFEDYPHFMQGVDSVQQIDDTHLHWVTKASDRALEWDAEITEQQPDRCIAWQNTSGPAFGGRVDVQPVGNDTARVTLTLESGQDAGLGSGEAEMADRVRQDLSRLKQFLETRGSETGAWRGEVHAAQASGSAKEVEGSTQSDYALSQSTENDAEDGRFSVSEEVSLDMQSDEARRVGQAPSSADAVGKQAADGMGQAMKQEGQQQADAGKLKDSIERSTPPST